MENFYHEFDQRKGTERFPIHAIFRVQTTKINQKLKKFTPYFPGITQFLPVSCGKLLFPFFESFSPRWLERRSLAPSRGLPIADVYVTAAAGTDQMSVLFFGLLIGAVLSATAYLFFIWVVMRDRGQVFLILFLLCLCANIFSSNTLLMNKLGFNDPLERDFVANLSLITSWISALFFTFYFLELDINNPSFRLPFVLLGVSLLLFLVYSLINPTLAYFAMPAVGVTVVTAILIAGLSGVRNGTSGSLVHIIAFICFLGGILAEPAYILGYLKTQGAVNNATYAFFALSSMIFAIVIANQFAARQDEKEKALAVSNERFALATRGANEGLFDWNLQTGEVFFSDQFRRILGFRLVNGAEGLKKWVRMIQPPYRRLVTETVRRFRRNATAVTLTVEYCIERPNGERRWLHSKAVAVRDRTTQKVMRMVGSTSDMFTERKKSEFALLASESRLRSIIEAHPVPILIVSLGSGSIFYAAPGSEQLLGMKQEDIQKNKKSDSPLPSESRLRSILKPIRCRFSLSALAPALFSMRRRFRTAFGHETGRYTEKVPRTFYARS